MVDDVREHATSSFSAQDAENVEEHRPKSVQNWKRNYHTSRDATRISLFENFERWRALLHETGLAKDKDLAKHLMDLYDMNRIQTRHPSSPEHTITVMAGDDSSGNDARIQAPLLRSKRHATSPTDMGTPYKSSRISPYDTQQTVTASEAEVTDIENELQTPSQSLSGLSSSLSEQLIAIGASTPIIHKPLLRLTHHPPSQISIKSSRQQLSQTFDDITQSASESDDTDDQEDDGSHSSFSEDALDLDKITVEDEVYDTILDGHDDDECHESIQDEENAKCGTTEMSPDDVVKAEKCIVFTDKVMELLKTLHGEKCERLLCDKVLDYKKTYVGTCLVVSWGCNSGHFGGRWTSQPTTHKLRAGNLLLAAALLLSGNSFTKIGLMFKFMKLQYFSQGLFYQYQKLYIAPAVNKIWETIQTDLWDKRNGSEIVLGGDGRNDSPGHSAQYCTYTLADVNTKEILQINVVDVREANGKSNNMERIGFERGLNNLLTSGNIAIKEVVTDGHLEIAALMKKSEKYEDIKHQMDVWHGSKGIIKKLIKASRVKGNEDLAHWASAISNHFWYCSRNCGGNTKTLKDKWIGILHHIVDEHEWVLSEGVNEGKCDHEPLDNAQREKPWLQKNDSAHKALRKIVLDKRLLNTFRYYTNFRHTGNLESFHNHILMYAPKRHSYSFIGYKVRNHIAAIDYNMHRERKVAKTSCGKERARCQYSKRTKRWRPVKLLQPKEYKYIPDLIKTVFEERASSDGGVNRVIGLSPDDPRNIARNIATVPRPTVKSLIEAHKSRFTSGTF